MTPWRAGVTRLIEPSRPQARLRELEERLRAVRQAKSARRQAVLLVGGHLAEGAGVAVGQEHRIVAEARGAARRPHECAVSARLELLAMSVRPGDAQRGHEMRRALPRRRRATRPQLVL